MAMADAPSIEALETMFARLPREGEDPEHLTRRIRITTVEGRTIFAFLRAGQGTLSFGGWDATRQGEGTEVSEPQWAYFLLAAEKPGAPLQVISQRGPLGTVSAAELEERGSEQE
jgi:hypothetical protein